MDARVTPCWFCRRRNLVMGRAGRADDIMLGYQALVHDALACAIAASRQGPEYSRLAGARQGLLMDIGATSHLGSLRTETVPATLIQA